MIHSKWKIITFSRIIANKNDNCLWRPCLLTDQDDMSTLYNIEHPQYSEMIYLSNCVVSFYHLILITLKIIIKLQVSFNLIIGASCDTIIFFGCNHMHNMKKQIYYNQCIYSLYNISYKLPSDRLNNHSRSRELIAFVYDVADL